MEHARSTAEEPVISVVIPLYEENILSLYRLLRDACDSLEKPYEIIFVDDGSKDASLDIMKKRARPQDTVLTKPNGGKGSAVHNAIPHITGVYTIIQDGDLEYDPADIPILLQRAEQESLPVLYGSRRLMQHEREYAKWIYYLGGNVVTAITNILFRSSLTDMMTCYKLIRSDLFKALPLRTNDFRLEPEITGLLLLRGVTIEEVPINYHPRTREEGKKIGWKDFFRCLVTLIQVRFGQL